MANAPRRSTGCITCQKRKKGCDKSRPHCQRCIKAGLPCGGYARPHGFVWVDSQKATDEEGSAQSIAVPGVLPSNGPRTTEYTSHKKTNANIILMDGLARSAREQLYLGAFGSAILPGGRRYSPIATNFGVVGWTNFISELIGTETSLKYASIAIGAALVSSDSLDTQLRVKSIQSYNRAVHEVAKALKKPDWHRHDGLLATTRLMSFYEVLFPPIDKAHTLAWRGHYEGLRAMLLARGPHSFVSGAAHQVYSDSRISMIILAIYKRRRSPFSTGLWKTVPWSVQKKSIKDELLDLVEEMATLLEQVDAFRTLHPVGATKFLEKRILDQCGELELDFAKWEQRMSPDIEKFDYTAAEKKSLPVPDDDAACSLLHLSIIYWISMMMLYSIINYFRLRLQDGEDASVQDAAHNERCHGKTGCGTSASRLKCPRVYALKCLRAMHLYFEGDGGFIGRVSGLLTLGFAARYFLNEMPKEQTDDEAESFAKILDTMVFGTPVRHLLAQLSGGKLPTNANAGTNGNGPPASEISWF